MKKLSYSVIAASIATSTLLSGFSTNSAFAEQTEQENKQTSFTAVGELPPVDPNTNLPVVMTATETVHPITQYTVQLGDTLDKIAAGFVLDVDTLKTWNNLLDESLEAGQVLSVAGQVIPTPEQQAALDAAAYEKQKAYEDYLVYVDYVTEINRVAKVEAEAKAAEAKAAAAAQAVVQQQQVQASNVQAEAKAPTSGNVIDIAYQYLGVPYVFGGTTPAGFDCSGYISYVFKKAGKLNSHYNAAGLYNISQKVSNPQVGDLVFFSGTYKPGISHVGIYIGNNKMINASGKKVQISNIYDSYWGAHFTGFGRI